ncbi:hypothetical protein PS834_02967 [Pseudomonas fluorescens]|jgi:hypothetical protein|nr:hypothetical protein PS834_02967 [Pseudomonas fluorescens]
MNYLVIHKPSQLILKVITTSQTPTPDELHMFHPASTTVLNKYYKLAAKSRRNGVLVNVGDLAAVSPSFLESLADSKHHQ